MNETYKGKSFPFNLTNDNNISYVASSPTTGTEESPNETQRIIKYEDYRQEFSNKEKLNEGQVSAMNLISTDI